VITPCRNNCHVAGPTFVRVFLNSIFGSSSDFWMD
jgi:hypothetical protein